MSKKEKIMALIDNAEKNTGLKLGLVSTTADKLCGMSVRAARKEIGFLQVECKRIKKLNKLKQRAQELDTPGE